LYIEVIMTIYFYCYTRDTQGFSTRIFNICSMAFCLALFLYLQFHWVDRFQSLITSSIDSQCLFQSIFDNSDDCIIIVTAEKAETINKTFINEFEVRSYQYYPQINHFGEKMLKNKLNFIKKNDI
jgi:hypothetical protein